MSSGTPFSRTVIARRTAIIEYNRQREKTFSQRMAEADELCEIESERAKQRQGSRTDIQETFPESSRGETRDVVGKL